MYLVAWRIAVASRLSCDRNENVRTANRKRKFKTMDHDPKSIKVMKFGGTSVGSPAMIKHVARLISNEEPKLVVLSAMSGTTKNALAAIAAELSRGNISGASDDIGNFGKQIPRDGRSALFFRRKRGKGEKAYPGLLFLIERSGGTALFVRRGKNRLGPRRADRYDADAPLSGGDGRSFYVASRFGIHANGQKRRAGYALYPPECA